MSPEAAIYNKKNAMEGPTILKEVEHSIIKMKLRKVKRPYSIPVEVVKILEYHQVSPRRQI